MKITLDTLAAALTEVDAWVDAYPADTVLALWEARAWEMLDLQSWEALCDSRGWTRRVALPRPERQEIVGRLRQEGMSTRAIAAAVGVSHPTIQSDLKSTGKDLPDEITSLDGRTRPATQPARVIEPEIVDAEVIDDEPPVLTSQQWMAREGYTDDSLPRRRTEAEKQYQQAEAEEQAIRNLINDAHLAFTIIDGYRHPETVQRIRAHWVPQVRDWTATDIRELASILTAVADQWETT